jgi:putative transposase
MQLAHSNLVWATDITFVPMPVGFLYLVAIIDWFSRYVPAWTLSNTLDMGFCLAALDAALSEQQPCVFN